MSSLEWMQRQHYKAFRKLLVDDPYNAIFGFSNARLSGKGLTDWEWINKSFPRWMLREMESHEEPDKRYKERKGAESELRNPKKIEIRSEDPDVPQKRGSHFPQPSYRATRLNSDDLSGIVSPSDLRRPREQPGVKVVGRYPEADATSTFNPKPNPVVSSENPQPTRPKSTAQFRDFVVKTRSDAAAEMYKSNRNIGTAEPSFMNQFLADKVQDQESRANDTIEDGTWKQTVLQRRSSPGSTAKPNSEPAPVTKAPKETPNLVSPTPETNGLSFNAGTVKQFRVEAARVETNNATSLAHAEPSREPESGISQDRTAPVRSTSKILSQLPEDDIDFLSADAIRASMTARKSKILKDEHKEAERLNLEKTFENALKTGAAIDPMIESKVINDQYVRRIERQMRGSRETQEVEETPKATGTENATPAEELTLESSVDRMKRWLERGGATFSSIFWQDPAEEADAEKTRLFFDKVLGRIRKGRLTMKQVVADLETDIPASKPLLKRMKADEELLDSAINALRQRSGSGKMQSLTPKKIRALQQLRLKYRDTDRELDDAYAKLRELSDTEAAKSASLALKRRLSIASKITQKNAHLTRYLIWSLQARLEDPDVDPSRLPNYKAVANSLLTLRDTQMALSRMVERAMLVYKVEPQAIDILDMLGLGHPNGVEIPTQTAQSSQPPKSTSMSEVEKAQLRAKIAADERLANEVDAQKSAMRGLSDDGYARVPKTVIGKSIEEREPLAHSLFRPFGPVLESLGSSTVADAEAQKAEEEAAQKQRNTSLIADLKTAYEDSYGPITVGHTQMVDADEAVKKEQDIVVQKFNMLKDDPSSEAITNPVNSTASEVRFSVSRVSGRGPHFVSLHGRPGSRSHHVVEARNIPKAVQDAAPATETLDTYAQATETTSSPAPSANLPTHYTILIHDLQTNKLSLTTSTSGPPRDTSPVLALHQALAALDQPAKFIPYITEGLEVVTAKKDMLVLRNALDPTSSSTKPFETFSTSSAPRGGMYVHTRGTVNPIDGTTRLSPTGYASPEESQEQLEEDFDERREMARAFGVKKSVERAFNEGQERAKRGRGVGLVKTAIWAAAGCYVVGVLGELASGV
jgi:hypothetical protein